MCVGKKIKFILSDLTDTVHSELYSKRFFKSVVMQVCRLVRLPVLMLHNEKVLLPCFSHGIQYGVITSAVKLAECSIGVR